MTPEPGPARSPGEAAALPVRPGGPAGLLPHDPAGLPMLPGDPCLAHGCSACCHDTEMLLTEADVARLRQARPGEAFWFQAEDGFLQLGTQEPPGAPDARYAAGAPCWFLVDGRCSVWQDRPEGCRLYPAVWDGRRVLLDAEHCPHTADFTLPEDAPMRALVARLQDERDARIAAEDADRQRVRRGSSPQAERDAGA